ncbi:hypothetical protein, partial [Novipirellula herctigrandis]|uniref:hypothetical protein n=1 Tax=Novipirellula herctigrandis TaxID=2527986 RepID=UPI003AF354E3
SPDWLYTWSRWDRPGKRTWSFHTCSGSGTPSRPTATRRLQLADSGAADVNFPHKGTRSARESDDFGAHSWPVLPFVLDTQHDIVTCDRTSKKG